jgi:hypothetical protein
MKELLLRLQSDPPQSVKEMEQLYRHHRLIPDDVSDLLSILMTHSHLESICTWLIKRYQKDGKDLNPSHVSILIDNLAHLKTTHGKLHVLQILSRLHLSKALSAELIAAVEPYLNDKHKFIQASAFDAYAAAARHFPSLEAEFKQRCALVLPQANASLAVKLRRILNAKKS